MCVSVCLSVTTKSATYLVFTFAKKVLKGSLWCFQRFYRLAFPENTLFKSYGVICRSPLPSSLPGELSTAKRDSDGFFSTRKVYMVSYRSNNKTGSSLIILLHSRKSFLAISAWYKMLTQHYTRDAAGHYAIACNVHSCGYSDIVLAKIVPGAKEAHTLHACKLLALMQYCSVLARRGFCTIVLH